MQAINQNCNAIYLSNCDLINKGLISDINQIPKIDKIVIKLSSLQNKKLDTNISSSDLNSQLKMLLMFYFILGINPKIKYNREKNLNYQADEKDNDSFYVYKIVLENTLDVQKFIHYFFVESSFHGEFISTNMKFTSVISNKILSLKLIVPSLLDQDIENIFNISSKETSIKDLNLSVDFLVNSKSVISKTKIKNEIKSIYPLWILAIK